MLDPAAALPHDTDMAALDNPATQKPTPADLPPPDLPPLVRDPVGKTILGLALPATLGISAMISTSILDTYLARFLGATEQAALSLIFPVTFMLSSLALGLMVGTVSLVARTRGTGDIAGVQRITGQALVLSCIVIAVFSVVGLLGYHSLFRATHVPVEVMPKIEDYLGIWFFGTIVMVFPTLGNGVLRACGNAIASSTVLVMCGVLKLLLAPALVLGWWIFPRLELQGAALSNIFAFGGGSALVMWYLMRDNLIAFRGWRTGIAATWRKVLVIGLPSSLTNLLMPICGFLANTLVVPLGPAVVAGYGNALRLETLALVPMLALSGSIGPFLGQNVGAGRRDRMRDGFAFSIRFALLYGVAIALLLFASGQYLSGVFAATPLSVAPSRLYLWIVPISFGFYGVLMCVAGAFNGLGNPKPNLVLYTTKAALFAVGILIGSQLDGYRGLCIGIALSNIGAGLAAYWWYRRSTAAWALTQ
jgi:putative MATE family efflux protein